jgi:hypothetical protein
LFELKNFLYAIKNQQVEARDPHLPPFVQRDDYHDVGHEDDSMSAVGGLLVTGILDNDHRMDLVEQFCGRSPPEDEDAKRAKRTNTCKLQHCNTIFLW